MAQEHAQARTSGSATSKESLAQFAWPQRKQVELQQLFELFVSLSIRLTVKVSSSTWQGKKPESLPVKITLSFAHTATPCQG